MLYIHGQLMSYGSYSIHGQLMGHILFGLLASAMDIQVLLADVSGGFSRGSPVFHPTY